MGFPKASVTEVGARGGLQGPFLTSCICRPFLRFCLWKLPSFLVTWFSFHNHARVELPVSLLSDPWKSEFALVFPGSLSPCWVLPFWPLLSCYSRCPSGSASYSPRPASLRPRCCAPELSQWWLPGHAPHLLGTICRAPRTGPSFCLVRPFVGFLLQHPPSHHSFILSRSVYWASLCSPNQFRSD